MGLMDIIKGFFGKREPDPMKEIALLKEARQDKRLDALMDSFNQEKEIYRLKEARKYK